MLLSCSVKLSYTSSLCGKINLEDAYIKVTTRLVWTADSGVIKWIIHVDWWFCRSWQTGDIKERNTDTAQGELEKDIFSTGEKKEEVDEKHRLRMVAAVPKKKNIKLK